jgi:hypothetical protein
VRVTASYLCEGNDLVGRALAGIDLHTLCTIDGRLVKRDRVFLLEDLGRVGINQSEDSLTVCESGLLQSRELQGLRSRRQGQCAA